MNFSKNYKLCKILALTLVFSIVCTLFTGCFGKSNESTEESTDPVGPAPGLSLSETTTPTEAETEPPVPETTEPNENMGTVLSQLTIRNTCDTAGVVLGSLAAGDRVEIVRREEVYGEIWGYILSPVSGWICLDYVKMDVEPEIPAGSNTSTPAGGNTTPTEPEGSGEATNIKGVITVNGLNIRSEASTTNSKIQGSYNKGDVVTILETKNGWGRTNQGWIKMEYVNTAGNTTNSQNNTNNTQTNQNTGNNNTTTQGNKPQTNITSDGNTTVKFKGIVTASELNIRPSASTEGDRLGYYVYGDRVEFLEKSGNWGRTKKGWISLSYVYQDGTTGTKTAKGTIDAEGGLRIRSGPGTGYASVGTYADGDAVSILEQFSYNGKKWGCTNKGWISMEYVDIDGDDDSDDDDDGLIIKDDDNDKVTGTVTANGLRIRSGAGTDYKVVGSLDYGDEVVILEQKEADDMTWGKIKEGWISMEFVDLD